MIENLESLFKKLDKLGKDAIKPVERGLEKSTKTMVGKAKLLTRVDTGTLRSSIIDEQESSSEKVTSQFGTNIEYGIFNELGTSKMSAQPFITPAFESTKGDIARNIRKELVEELKK